MKFPQLFKKVFRATAIFVTITAGITLLDIAQDYQLGVVPDSFLQQL